VTSYLYIFEGGEFGLSTIAPTPEDLKLVGNCGLTIIRWQNGAVRELDKHGEPHDLPCAKTTTQGGKEFHHL
jgi:hypothetical protein